MTPTPKPIMALFRARPAYAEPPEPVAILALDEASYLAVDGQGRTVQGDHGQFEITDGDVRYVALQADIWMGS